MWLRSARRCASVLFPLCMICGSGRHEMWICMLHNERYHIFLHCVAAQLVLPRFSRAPQHLSTCPLGTCTRIHWSSADL